ncbi:MULTISPECIES: hypothetical protein [unclassified Streptomyces]|uniref:hypothetical protein n=1 Tax=unclassified Streptomyces TaxID=2593676 RepID=UPI0027DC1584|nr:MULTISPECIES: hypothetical protein [unclassified Streptomyces]
MQGMQSDAATYRPGVHVIDRRTGELGRVMDHEGSHLQLRPPHGGVEWDCPPDAARLATQAERRAAGVAANGTECRPLAEGTGK